MMAHATPIALVTGGAQGIGRAIATRLLRQKMHVVIADRDAQACADVTNALAPEGSVEAHTCDVADETQVRGLIQHVQQAHGRLDGLVNNAGITVHRRLDQMTLDEWHHVLTTNLTSMFLCVREAQSLLTASSGAVVNIASTRALMSEPDSEAYAASKGGVVSLTHALAISLGPAVRVNCISPGWIDTRAHQKGDRHRVEAVRDVDHQQHPVGRVGQPEDIAAAVSHLLSADAAFITGQNVVIDGGMTRKMIYAE